MPRKKIAIYPKNDTVSIQETRQSPNDGQTGGSRLNPDPGVPHLPDGYSNTADKSIGEQPKGLKAVIILVIGKKLLVNLDELRENLRRISDLQINHKFKPFISKKHKKLVVLRLVSLPEARKTELKMICNQLNLPVLFLPELKGKEKQASDINMKIEEKVSNFFDLNKNGR